MTDVTAKVFDAQDLVLAQHNENKSERVYRWGSRGLRVRWFGDQDNDLTRFTITMLEFTVDSNATGLVPCCFAALCHGYESWQYETVEQVNAVIKDAREMFCSWLTGEDKGLIASASEAVEKIDADELEQHRTGTTAVEGKQTGDHNARPKHDSETTREFIGRVSRTLGEGVAVTKGVLADALCRSMKSVVNEESYRDRITALRSVVHLEDQVLQAIKPDILDIMEENFDTLADAYLNECNACSAMDQWAENKDHGFDEDAIAKRLAENLDYQKIADKAADKIDLAKVADDVIEKLDMRILAKQVAEEMGVSPPIAAVLPDKIAEVIANALIQKHVEPLKLMVEEHQRRWDSMAGFLQAAGISNSTLLAIIEGNPRAGQQKAMPATAHAADPLVRTGQGAYAKELTEEQILGEARR